MTARSTTTGTVRTRLRRPAATSSNDVVVTAPTLTTPPFDISGVAPHANVISYLGCCTLAGLTMAIDQAIADGVDVINYSIGSSSPSAAWDDFDTVGFLNARAAGIFVATSNGNDGPFEATTGSPADAPWLTSVGASTHNRHNGNVLTDLVSSEGPLPDIAGKSVAGSLGPTPIIDAGAFGDPACVQATGNEANFVGRIVVCERGRERQGREVGQRRRPRRRRIRADQRPTARRLAARRRVPLARCVHLVQQWPDVEGVAGRGQRPSGRDRRNHVHHR